MTADELYFKPDNSYITHTQYLLFIVEMALTDNLVAYWKLDESSGDATDAS